jgi:hypothetical protein
LVARQEVPLCTECVEGSEEHLDAQRRADGWTRPESGRHRWHDKK